MITTIVAVFDNAVDLDRALTRLVEEGFDDVVSDDGNMADEASGKGLVAFVPHLEQSATRETGGPERKLMKANQSQIVKAFKEHLADHHLSDDVIQGYTVTFLHDGKFVIVDTKPNKAETAMKILIECGATRVNRHG